MCLGCCEGDAGRNVASRAGLPNRAGYCNGLPMRSQLHPRSSRLRGCSNAHPVVLPIPGPSKVAHLKENVAAAFVELTSDQIQHIDKASYE